MEQLNKTVQFTDKEVFFNDDDFIVTKTDLKGKITYCNRSFMRIVNTPWKNLIGQHHNIIRHPNMPKTAFYNLWQTLKNGDEWFGFVKNMTANGSFYWVFANVTIDKRNGEPIGYYSVRRPAPREALKVIEPLYAELNSIESRQGMQASINYFNGILEKNNTNYQDFILDLYFKNIQGA